MASISHSPDYSGYVSGIDESTNINIENQVPDPNIMPVPPVPVNLKRNKICMRCELPFRNEIDDGKYRWCLECRQKKREKNRKERTTKKKKVTGNPSFAADNPNEDHFKRFDTFEAFLEYILNRKVDEQTDAIFQTVFSERQIPRFPKRFNFVTIGAKTVVKRRGYIVHVSEDDDEAMKRHIETMTLAPVVESTAALKSLNLVTTPLLSLAGLYLEKRLGLIIVHQVGSGSFIIQNSLRFLDIIVNKLSQTRYKAIFELNSLSSSKLQDQISKLFAEHSIDQHDALQAYRAFKDEKFSMLHDLPHLLSQFEASPKLKNIDQAKKLRQTIDEQLIRFADKISNVTDYQFARKRRDVSQNGNFVINHYCRQDSHYRKLPTVDNRKTEDCKSKLAMFYNCIDGDFKIVYSHKEHCKDLVDPVDQHQMAIDYLDRPENNIDVNLIAQQQQQQQQNQQHHQLDLNLSTQLQGNPDGLAGNIVFPSENDATSIDANNVNPSSNPQWRTYSHVLSFGDPHHDM